MLEWKVTKSDHRVPLVEGKAMASMIDPVREAKSWAKRLEEGLYNDTEAIVVLGLGAGYHLEELAKKTNKEIHCIDLFEELVLEKTSSESLHYYYLDRPSNFWQTPSVCNQITGKMQIFIHGPSTQVRRSAYFELRNEIALRTQTALQNYIKSHGKIDAVDSIKLKENNGLLDLGRTVSSIDLNTKKENAILWKILGEFIK